MAPLPPKGHQIHARGAGATGGGAGHAARGVARAPVHAHTGAVACKQWAGCAGLRVTCRCDFRKDLARSMLCRCKTHAAGGRGLGRDVLRGRRLLQQPGCQVQQQWGVPGWVGGWCCRPVCQPWAAPHLPCTDLSHAATPGGPAGEGAVPALPSGGSPVVHSILLDECTGSVLVAAREAGKVCRPCRAPTLALTAPRAARAPVLAMLTSACSAAATTAGDVAGARV